MLLDSEWRDSRELWISGGRRYGLPISMDKPRPPRSDFSKFPSAAVDISWPFTPFCPFFCPFLGAGASTPKSRDLWGSFESSCRSFLRCRRWRNMKTKIATPSGILDSLLVSGLGELRETLTQRRDRWRGPAERNRPSCSPVTNCRCKSSYRDGRAQLDSEAEARWASRAGVG